MVELFVTALNHNYPHAPDYVLDRPRGYDEYVFIHFLTPCEIGSAAGREPGEPGECLIYTPGFPQWNRGLRAPLFNNWLHFHGPAAAGLLLNLELPLNTKFRPRETSFIEPAIIDLKRELLGGSAFSAQAIEGKLRLFLVNLARRRRLDAPPGTTPAEAARIGDFRRLRTDMLSRLQTAWSVPEMARQLHLSRSRFTVLYRKFFGVSPLADLLAARLEQAQLLLASSSLTLEAVAAHCGFPCPEHFHRLFRKRFGTTPRRSAKN